MYIDLYRCKNKKNKSINYKDLAGQAIQAPNTKPPNFGSFYLKFFNCYKLQITTVVQSHHQNLTAASREIQEKLVAALDSLELGKLVASLDSLELGIYGQN